MSPGGADNLVKLNEGYRVLRTLRSSPPYWEQEKKDIFAMIRQLGLPTWFISLSAAETKWVSLLKVLAKLFENKDCSDDEVTSFSWKEKCDLLRSYPVTCVRSFDVRAQNFMTMVLKDKSPPIGPISDFSSALNFSKGLDYIYTNIATTESVNCGVLESYFSDHFSILQIFLRYFYIAKGYLLLSFNASAMSDFNIECNFSKLDTL